MQTVGKWGTDFKERKAPSEGVRMEDHTWRHELPQLLWHNDALLCLVVLQDGADGPGGSTHRGIKHVDKFHLGRAGSTGKLKPSAALPDDLDPCTQP